MVPPPHGCRRQDRVDRTFEHVSETDASDIMSMHTMLERHRAPPFPPPQRDLSGERESVCV